MAATSWKASTVVAYPPSIFPLISPSRDIHQYFSTHSIALRGIRLKEECSLILVDESSSPAPFRILKPLKENHLVPNLIFPSDWLCCVHPFRFNRFIIDFLLKIIWFSIRCSPFLDSIMLAALQTCFSTRSWRWCWWISMTFAKRNVFVFPRSLS